MMNMKLVSLFFLLLTTAACKKSVSNSNLQAETFLNVSYGSNSLQKMDVYLPAKRNADTKVVVFIHGGSFIGGDKSDYTALVEELYKKNFAVLNINYRLVDGSGLETNPITHKKSSILIQDQVIDVSAAVDFVISKVEDWQVSNSKIAVVGHSAGATLALLYSYGDKNTGKVKAVANLAGALDQTFTDLPNYNLLPPPILEFGYRYTGFEVSPTNEQYYKAISPLYVANAGKKINTLTIFPENNVVGAFPKQNRATFDAFTNRLNQLGISNKFVQIPGADHSFTTAGSVQLMFIELLTFLGSSY
ncbi:alpha/beta hydrolase [Nubsella zeaxanthinifaciens]|uniref:alpha/beta hydrolase n=1 Tax=Nubsella zeaxanthinifaciens TaxID=392412 RepID=UPI003CFDE0DB